MLFYEIFLFLWLKIKFYAKNLTFLSFSYLMAKMGKNDHVLARNYIFNPKNRKIS